MVAAALAAPPRVPDPPAATTLAVTVTAGFVATSHKPLVPDPPLPAGPLDDPPELTPAVPVPPLPPLPVKFTCRSRTPLFL